MPQPFESRTPWTAWESTKLVLMTVTLIAPIRFVTITGLSLSIWFLSYLAQGRVNQPMHSWQKWLLYPCRYLIRLIMFVGGFYWVDFEDRRSELAKRQSQPPVFVANHISIWDPFYLYYLYGVSISTKAEFFNVPIMGTMLKGAFQGIPIERESPEGRAASRQTLRGRAGNPQFPPVCTFPEGTTHQDQCLTRFKTGIFEAGKPVTPVVLEYPNVFNDLFFGTQTMFTVMYHTCCQFINHHRVVILEPRQPEGTAEQFANNVRDDIASELAEVTVTNHDYEDYKIYRQYHQTRPDVCQGYIVQVVRKQLKLSFDEFKVKLDEFVHESHPQTLLHTISELTWLETLTAALDKTAPDRPCEPPCN